MGMGISARGRSGGGRRSEAPALRGGAVAEGAEANAPALRGGAQALQSLLFVQVPSRSIPNEALLYSSVSRNKRTGPA